MLLLSGEASTRLNGARKGSFTFEWQRYSRVQIPIWRRPTLPSPCPHPLPRQAAKMTDLALGPELRRADDQHVRGGSTE